MYFHVGADFDKLKKLKNDIDDLKSKLQGMDEKANPKSFKELEKQLSILNNEFEKGVKAAANMNAQAQASFGGMTAASKDFIATTSASSHSLDEMSKKIEIQKQKIGELSQAQLDAFNKLESVQFDFKIGNTDITKENVAFIESEFNKINQALEEEKSNLEILNSAYNTILNDISNKAKISSDSINKSISSSLPVDTFRISAEEVQNEIKLLEKEFTSATSKFNKSLSDDKVKDKVAVYKTYLNELSNITKRLSAYSGNAEIRASSDPKISSSYQTVKKLLTDINTEIRKERGNIDNVNATTTKQVSLLSQIRQIREEMAALQNKDGSVNNQNISRYEQLKLKLAEIGTTYRRVQQEQKYLTTAGNAMISGLLSGMSAVSGAFSAGSGVVSLFVTDNAKLAAIQTKLQAAMAITIGLQQVSTALHSTSAFRMNVTTKVTNLYSASVLRLGTSFIKMGVSAGVARVAAQALMATLTLGLSVAITGIIYLIDKFNTEQTKTKEASAEVSKGVGQQIASLIKLSQQWKQLGDDLNAQKKFLIENGNEIRDLTNKTLDLSQADNLFVKNTGKFIEALILRARAEKKYKDVEEKTSNLADIEQQIDNEYEILLKKGGTIDGKSMDTDIGKLALNYSSQKMQELKKQRKTILKETESFLSDFIKLSDSEKKVLQDLGLSSSNMLDGSIAALERNIGELRSKYKEAATDIERSNILKQIREQEKLLNEIDKSKKTSTNPEAVDRLKFDNDKIKALLDVRSALLENQQKLLNIEEDGFEKKQKQIELNHQKELLTIEKNAQELIEKRQQEEYKQWKLDNPKGSKNSFVSNIKTIQDLSIDDKKLLEDSTIIANKTKQKANEDLLKSLLSKYQDYVKQREIIEKQFNQDTATLEKQRTKENSNEIDRALTEVAKKKKEALSAINMDELRNSIDWQQVLGDLDRASEQTVKILKDKLKDYVQEAGNKLSPTDLKTLTQAVTQLEQKYAQLKPNKAFTDSFDQYKKATQNVKQLKKELDEIKAGREVIIGINYNKETGEIIPILKSVAQAEDDLTKAQDKRRIAMYNLALAADGYNAKLQSYTELTKTTIDTFSDFGVKIPKGLNQMVEGITKVSDGINDFSKGLKNTDPIQIIQSGIKVLGGLAKTAKGLAGVVKTVKGLFGGKVNQEHREALRVLEEQRKELQRIVALEKLREELNYKQGETVFGSDKWGKARNGAVTYAKSVKELRESLKALEDVDIVTGSKKSGWGPWKKRKDDWSDLLNAYPELINANGEFDKTLAETIINTQKLDDEGKKAIQNAIENAELVEEAYSAMKDQLTDIFQDLGYSITNAFVDAFKNGTDAAQTATESIGQMLENLVTQMVYSVTIAPLMEEYSNQMMAISSNTNLTDKEKLDAYTDTIGSLTKEAIAKQDLANQLLGNAQDKAKEQGIAIFKPDSNTYSQSSTKGGYETMTQDQAGEMNGRFTAIQESAEVIKEGVITLSNRHPVFDEAFKIGVLTQEHISISQEIRTIQLNSYYELRDINKNTKELYGIREELESMNKTLADKL